MSISYPLILDVLLAVLLIVTIWYAVVLNKRLSVFRRNREEMERLAATFHDATSRASDSIDTLKLASDALQDQLNKATSLRDDLVFLIDRGTSAADRLEDGVRGSRVAGGSPASDGQMGEDEVARRRGSNLAELVGAAMASEEAAQDGGTGSERALRTRAGQASTRKPKPRPKPAAMTSDKGAETPLARRRAAPTVGGMEAEPVSGREMFGDVGDDFPATLGRGDGSETGEEESPRSEAERALLKAIRSAT